MICLVTSTQSAERIEICTKFGSDDKMKLEKSNLNVYFANDNHMNMATLEDVDLVDTQATETSESVVSITQVEANNNDEPVDDWMEITYHIIVDALQRLDPLLSAAEVEQQISSIGVTLPDQIKTFSLEDWDTFLNTKLRQASGKGSQKSSSSAKKSTSATVSRTDKFVQMCKGMYNRLTSNNDGDGDGDGDKRRNPRSNEVKSDHSLDTQKKLTISFSKTNWKVKKKLNW